MGCVTQRKGVCSKLNKLFLPWKSFHVPVIRRTVDLVLKIDIFVDSKGFLNALPAKNVP